MKRFISSLIIFSMLWVDVARAMEEDERPPSPPIVAKSIPSNTTEELPPSPSVVQALLKQVGEEKDEDDKDSQLSSPETPFQDPKPREIESPESDSDEAIDKDGKAEEVPQEKPDEKSPLLPPQSNGHASFRDSIKKEDSKSSSSSSSSLTPKTNKGKEESSSSDEEEKEELSLDERIGEFFASLAALEDQRFTSASSVLRSINHEDAERLPLLSAAAQDNDLENQTLLSKASFLRQSLRDILQQNKDAVAEEFKAWIQANKNDPKWLESRIIDVLRDLLKKHDKFLPPSLQDTFNDFENNAGLTTLTLQDWLKTMGFLQEEGLGDLGKQPPLVKQFYTFFRAVLQYDLAYHYLTQQSEGMNERVKAFLAYFQKYDAEGQHTLKQKAASILALVTAAGASWGLEYIFFADSLEFLSKISMSYRWEFVFIASIFLDSFPRDWELFTEFSAPSKSKFLGPPQKKIWRALDFMGKSAVILPLAGLTVYYYSSAFTLTSWQDLLFFSSTSVWWLALDAAASVFLQLRIANEDLHIKWDQLKPRLQGTFIEKVPLLRHMLKQHIPSVPDIRRNDFIKSLKTMRKAVYRMEGDIIAKLYKEMYTLLAKDKKNTPKNKDKREELDAREAFLTLSYVRKVLENHAEEESEMIVKASSHLWHDRLAVGLGTFFALTASYARYLVYQYAGNFLFHEAFGIEDKIVLGILSNVFATIGWLFQGFGEETAIEENIQGILGKREKSQSSHPWARTFVGGTSGFMGLFFTLPYLVTGLLAMKSYSLPIQIICLFPFLFADGNSNAWLLNETYRSYIHGYDWLKGKICGNNSPRISVEYKRDCLIRWLDRLIKLGKEADPQVIMELDTFLKSQKTRGKATSRAPTLELEDFVDLGQTAM
ncbi:MAG: hypothetical protein ACD_16C00126G0006 [uncultured bacterium]|nr:MAG: hypothetical protein ACD_16C00126G0006 [uncultured bacterium]OFW74831.1 MAG: hypothetical protein A2Z80_00225 [Alphaproteobacteria bacterium GWA2_41_27]OFW85023.1 MAG: hypothetical protein A2W06_04890 [Alphaproteobacteria bacterium RBG_16_42_14]OFW85235.1 MAG: hypothetical protein A3E50_07705 [Alphaproteobacteria bacterium RIFCSPHIGHO2_12_FULL_42_100]OFW92064.1 MAG: hypothetical protein A2W46_01500 [Alphaproteobacteria bacterium RIFCSPHIGHO2_12_42_13]OFW93109.1 MAG: hypothetical protei